ncbi:Immunoglobulin superfamily DCC subclass member 3 [Collichthys lucidus]|nr:Immunoglobulin superfamily DCC subclass member 3 [Collichthys lucidus]
MSESMRNKRFKFVSGPWVEMFFIKYFTINYIVCICVLVSSGVMCEAELSFTLEPSDIIAVQEQPLMLHCQVNGIPPITTQWRHNGLLLTQDQHHTTFINGSLLIGHFQKTKSDGSSDEGDYECVAQNSFGLVVSRKARIQAASGHLADDEGKKITFFQGIADCSNEKVCSFTVLPVSLNPLKNQSRSRSRVVSPTGQLK